MKLSTAILSADPELADLIREAAQRHDLDIRLEPGVGYDRLARHQLEELKVLQPQVVFLDAGPDPRRGIEFAQGFLEDQPGAHFVLVADDASADVVLSAMRAGVAEFLPRPVTPKTLEESVAGLRRRLGGRPTSRRGGRVLAFVGAKGGVGTTTVATNFAVALQQSLGTPTLLVDLDLELGEAAMFLGIEPRFSVADMAANLHRIDDGLLATFVQPHESGIELLAAPWAPREAERVTPDHVRRLLAFLRSRYDHVIVDTTGLWTPLALAALESSDELFVLTQADVPCLRNIQRLRGVLDDLRDHGRVVHLVVNRLDRAAEISLKDVVEAVGMEIYWTLADERAPFTHAMNAGRPLVMAQSPAGAGIEGLVGKFTGVEAPPRRRRGLLQRLFPRRANRAAPAPPPRRAPANPLRGAGRWAPLPPAAGDER